MRNMAAVTLTELGFTGRRVGAMFGISEQYVSMLRGRTRRDGSAGLIRSQGRPPALGVGQRERARRWRGEGLSDTVIAARLDVHATTVGRALRGVAHPAAVSPVDRAEAVAEMLDLGIAEDTPAEDTPAEDTPAEDTPPTPPLRTSSSPSGTASSLRGTATPPPPRRTPSRASRSAAEEAPGIDPIVGGGARIGEGSFTSRYAGAMLLHAFLDRVGAAGVLVAGVRPRSRGAAIDDLGLLTATCLSFALGTATVEAGKHLVRAQLGPLAGLTALPELRTLRPRLAGLAEASATRWGCSAGWPRRCSAPTPRGWACTSSMTTSCPTQGRNRWARATTPNAATPNAAATTPWSPTTTPARCASPPATRPGSRSPCPGRWPSCARSSARTRRSCSGSTGAAPTRRCSRACRDAGADWLTWRRGDLAPHHRGPGAQLPGRTRRDLRGDHPGRRDGRDQRLRPGPPADPVRARHRRCCRSSPVISPRPPPPCWPGCGAAGGSRTRSNT